MYLPAMSRTSEKKSQTRLAIAATLFLASIAASLLISFLSHSSDTYWVAKRALPQGVAIRAEDLTLAKASLSRPIAEYLDRSANPIGAITRRAFKAGELLIPQELSDSSADLQSESLSLSIRSTDMPQSTSPGSLTSLYQVHDIRNGEVAIPPRLILSSVLIREIGSKGGNFGGEISVTVSLNRDDVPALLAATTSGRIVLVSTSG
jgi:hypothetical protein